jgi:hypothetical protein
MASPAALPWNEGAHHFPGRPQNVRPDRTYYANSFKLKPEDYTASDIPLSKMMADVVNGFHDSQVANANRDNVLTRTKRYFGNEFKAYQDLKSMTYTVDETNHTITLAYEDKDKDVKLQCPENPTRTLPRELAFLFEQYVAYRLCQVIGDIAMATAPANGQAMTGGALLTIDALKKDVEDGFERVLGGLHDFVNHNPAPPAKLEPEPQPEEKPEGYWNGKRWGVVDHFLKTIWRGGGSALPQNVRKFLDENFNTDAKKEYNEETADAWKALMLLIAGAREDAGRVAVYCRIKDLPIRVDAGAGKDLPIRVDAGAGAGTGYVPGTTSLRKVAVATASTRQEDVTFGPFKNIFFGRDTKDHTDFFEGAGKGFYEPPDVYESVHNMWAPDKRSVVDDISQKLENGSDVVLFGYGASGSGKTFSLFGRTKKTEVRVKKELVTLPIVDGIVQQVLKKFIDLKIAAIFEEYAGGVKQCTAFDAECMDRNVDPRMMDKVASNMTGKIVLLYKNTNFPNVLDSVVSAVKGDLVDNTNDFRGKCGSEYTGENHIEFVECLNEFRILNMRVRATANNSESSRSHLFIVFQDLGGRRFTVVDLGGIEDPYQMIETYYDKLKARFDKVQGPTDVEKKQRAGLEKALKLLDATDADGQAGTKKYLAEDGTEVNVKDLREAVRLRHNMKRYLTVQPIITLMNSINRGEKTHGKDALDKIETALLTDYLKAFTTRYAEILSEERVTEIQPSAQMSARDAILYVMRRDKAFVINPFEAYKPGDVIFQVSGKKAADNTNGSLIKPAKDLDYFNMLHVACLFLEGMYIRASLDQVKDMCLSNPPSDQSVESGPLTRRIFESLKAGDKPVNYIMMYTLKNINTIDTDTATLAHTIASTTSGPPLGLPLSGGAAKRRQPAKKAKKANKTKKATPRAAPARRRSLLK